MAPRASFSHRASSTSRRQNQTKPRIYAALAAIDRLITEQLNHILHHPKLQRLEASWRGLHYLLAHVGVSKRLIVKTLNASWAEISKDLIKAAEIDQSQLFHKVYEEEFGTSGGLPYSVLLIDHFIFDQGFNQREINLLKQLVQVGAAAFAPILMSVSANLFNLTRFQQLRPAIDLQRLFKQPEYLAWNHFRRSEDARFLALSLPRVLMRMPYTQTPILNTRFLFSERTEDSSGGGYLWGNPAYLHLTVIARSFANHNWFGDIRGNSGPDSGGMCDPLVSVESQTADRRQLHHFMTETRITETQDKALSEVGFVPLCVDSSNDHHQLVFYSSQTVQAFKTYQKGIATANAMASSMLQYILCASRFAHYIKKIARTKLGLFWRAEECQTFLEYWLRDYTMSNSTDDLSLQSRYPLNDFSVKVVETVGKPGYHDCVIRLKPHFQLENVSTSMTFFTELVASR